MTLAKAARSCRPRLAAMVASVVQLLRTKRRATHSAPEARTTPETMPVTATPSRREMLALTKDAKLAL
jgi:hypothetical protein